MLEDEEAIDRLEHDLRRLKIDFERFFSGGLKTPPEQLRQSVSTQINAMRSRHIRTFALRFRLHNLEARFHIFSVLFSRRLQELEAGTGRRARPEVREVDPHDGIVFDDKPDPEAVAVLYRELCRAREVAPATDLAQFQSYLTSQITQIRKKTGCTHVRFRIASEGDKVKLKAKPL